jgi:hypothetical protein
MHYLESLKAFYYKERQKLESMWIFKQESKMRLLRLRGSVTERAGSRLTLPELLGRSDISEEVKDNLLRDGKNDEQVKERLNKNLDDEFAAISSEEEAELKNTNYSADEYADYLFQSEKVAALEDALSEERLFPEDVYAELKMRNEKETAPGA